MKEAILDYLKTSAGKHVFGIVIAALVLLVGSSWLQEHDSRLKAESTINQTRVVIDGLQAQMKATDAANKTVIAALQKQRAEVKTAPQAVQAIQAEAKTDAEVQALDVQPLPDAPEAVRVNSVPLFQKLNSCAQCGDNLTAARSDLATQQAIDKQKDEQIAALKRKPTFWHRVKVTAITLGIGAAAGYAISHR
jgi:hypothetical protein